MQTQATNETLDATKQVLCHLIGRQTGSATIDDQVPIGQLGIADSPDSLQLFVWRLFDALFVNLEPHEISPDSTVAEMASRIDSRSPTDQWGLTPIQLFLGLRKALTAEYGHPPDGVRWDSNPYDVHQAMKPAGRFSFALFDWANWGYYDLLDALEPILGPEYDFYASISQKLNGEEFGNVTTVGSLVNCLWRLFTSKSKVAAPRFPANRPDTTDIAVVNTAARTGVTRLLAVVDLTQDVTIQDAQLLDDLCVKSSPTEVTNRRTRKACIADGRSVLDFELRTTFGVHPRGWHERVYGDLRFRLPLKVKTFADLVTYVVNRWKAS